MAPIAWLSSAPLNRKGLFTLAPVLVLAHRGVLIRRSISLHRNLFPITLKSYVIDRHPELVATVWSVLDRTYA